MNPPLMTAFMELAPGSVIMTGWILGASVLKSGGLKATNRNSGSRDFPAIAFG